MRFPLHFIMQCVFAIRSYTILLSSHTFLPTFQSNASVIRSYMFCATVAQILQKLRFLSISIWIRWLCPPLPESRPSPSGRLAISYAKSCFLLSFHTFCDKFLCVPGRPVSFRNNGIPGLPARGPICHPITTPPKSSTNV